MKLMNHHQHYYLGACCAMLTKMMLLASVTLAIEAPYERAEVRPATIERGGQQITTVHHIGGKTTAIRAVVLALDNSIANGDFTDGLNGWTPTIQGGDAAPGDIFAENERAVFLEGDSFLITLEQSFVMPANPEELSFDVIFDPGFEIADDFMPDAFEAQLLDDTGASVVPTWDPDATSFFNVQEDLNDNLGSGVTFDGLTVTFDLTSVPADTTVTLYFDLIGADSDTASGVRIDNVILTAREVAPFDCDAGGPYIIECNDNGTTIALDGSGSVDLDQFDGLNFVWTTNCPDAIFDDDSSVTPLMTVDAAAGCPLACNVSLSVSSDGGESESCTTIVTLFSIPPDNGNDSGGGGGGTVLIDPCDNDQVAPILVCLPTVEVTAVDLEDGNIAPRAEATDACPGEVVVIDDFDPNQVPGPDGTLITFTAVDAVGNAAQCQTMFRVVEIPVGPEPEPGQVIPGDDRVFIDQSVTVTDTQVENCGASPCGVMGLLPMIFCLVGMRGLRRIR